MEHLNLLQRIEKKSSEFSKGQRRLAQYITENYDIAAYLTASKLGKEAGVSESTVVRFAYQLDYEGYPELQKAIPVSYTHLDVYKRQHIAHDCNLACRYCFAEEGEYKGHRELMSAKVGKAALDFLVANSGNRHNLEVDFFGGEPTMNFGVVKEVVEYGRSLEEKHNKHFRFTLTTNGVLLNDEIMEFEMCIRDRVRTE